MVGSNTFVPSYHCLVLSALLCWYLPAVVSADDGNAAPVTTTIAQEQDIHRELDLTGSVTAARAARLSAATSGLVSVMHVDAGSTVSEGELLLALDPELPQLQVDSATALVEQAQEALKDARRRLAEGRKLIPQRSIAESAVRDLEAEVAGDEAALHEAEANAAYLQGVLRRHQLRAPFAGVVSAKLTELGEWIVPGQAVFELVALDDVRLDFSVSEDYLAEIQPDAPLSFSLNAHPGRSYNGRVATVVPVTDPNARTFLLRVLAQNPGRHMLPGMSVRANLKLATGRRGVTVPRDSILRFPDGRVVVWTIETQQGITVARENAAVTGVSFGSRVEIREGLKAGATVVVEGNETLQDGQQVTIRQAQASE